MVFESKASYGSEYKNDQPLYFKDLDVEKLRSVSERATSEYEGKYKNAIFKTESGKGNFELSEPEVESLNDLTEIARNRINFFISKETQWKRFEQFLNQRRQIFGTFGEDSRIRIDDNVTQPTEHISKEGLQEILVPANIKHIHEWRSIIDYIDDTLIAYRNGLAQGTSAVNFGKNIKKLYSFIKDTNKYF